MTPPPPGPSSAGRAFPRLSARRAMNEWCWSVVWHTVFRHGPERAHGWRSLLLRLFGAHVEPGVRIDRTASVLFPWNLRLGTGAIVRAHAIIECMAPVEIGPQAMIDRYVHLCTGTRDYQTLEAPIVARPVRIGRGAVLGVDSFVGPGVSVGEGTFLRPRASAFVDLPGHVVADGTPARPMAAAPPQVDAPR